ncbi:DUF6284 family protein [Kribbella sp. NPDC054772]
MTIIHLSAVAGDEPTASELAAIEQEMPLIEAELDLLNAEIAYINASPSASVLDTRRVRRAQRRVLDVARDLAVDVSETEVVA